MCESLFINLMTKKSFLESEKFDVVETMTVTKQVFFTSGIVASHRRQIFASTGRKFFSSFSFSLHSTKNKVLREIISF